jgi:hypothetical protein
MDNESLDQQKENKESDEKALLSKLTKEYQLISSKKGMYVNREEILKE